MRTVAIVGVGLIGGSFGLALRAAGFRGRILGVSSPPSAAEGLGAGCIDAGAPLAEACAEADLVFLAQPIGAILETLPLLDPLVKPGTLVTDAGSTKRAIVARASACLRRARFLGGHPMAGKETRGAAAAEAGLFKGRPWLLTPSPGDGLAGAGRLLDFLEAFGAEVSTMTPEEHDRAVARSSHVPQLVSTALAARLHSLNDPAIAAAAGPGLLGMTRLALSSYEIWRGILATNGDFIAEELAGFEAQLGCVLGSAERCFSEANSFAARLRGPRTGDPAPAGSPGAGEIFEDE
jgi:prephenate dehydrogenase